MLAEKEKLIEMIHEINTKVRELVSYVCSLEFMEPIISERPHGGASPADADRRRRRRFEDGTMTAATIAVRISRELGADIPKESVVKVGKIVGARPVYCERQHASRYSPEEAEKIMNIYREFNQI